MNASLSAKAKWRLIGKSVRGASHHRSGLPNQDAIAWSPDSGTGPIIALAIADGHGGPRYFRSDIGAALAVQAAISECEGLLTIFPADGDILSMKARAEQLLFVAIVDHWRASATGHLSQNPFSTEEIQALEKARGVAERESVEANALLSYGTTVLTALVTESFILYLQLGDGDILSISETGDVQRPLAHDARLIANETTSLCLPNAEREFRFGLQSLSETRPELLMLSTDGYANSFVDDDAFRKVGADFLELIRTRGLDAVNQNLETWLTETSKSGSGDDISLGLIYRVAETATVR